MAAADSTEGYRQAHGLSGAYSVSQRLVLKKEVDKGQAGSSAPRSQSRASGSGRIKADRTTDRRCGVDALWQLKITAKSDDFRAGFEVAKWRVFCHLNPLQSSPARLKWFCLTEPCPQLNCQNVFVVERIR